MKIWRPSIVTLTAVIALLSVPALSSASDTSGVTAAIDHAVAAFNKGDMNAWVAACDSPASIIDDFAPYKWQGSRACADWASAYAVSSKKNGITDGVVTLGTPWHVLIDGEHAYAVYPATFTYKQRGKPKKDNATFALTMTNTRSGWLISEWAWSDR
ncbi:MAG: hypothetical protein ABSF08_10605 [Candidatus Cybelea sp.]